ncbi:glycine betaine/proline transport system substrate-binding protein [Kushneria avicenniae]|uniref:Glycine betaine/proline transport system substrate-binding protein n=1 Tax=Kushneria avicenniae TaxID=402385 RepID=A0A1I1G592_9GAMM|nr:glycine betaine ABC transporter substrate-binding protein [Kushneria avicenniae]SFC06661.1 glycine betaine/proline transport system substrate-binding protein [Kushneria avicenniae]
MTSLPHLATGLLLGATLATTANAADSRPIAITDPGYATAQGTAYVVEALIQDRFGDQTRIVNTTSVPVIWEALNRNNGDIDIWTDVWLPNQAPFVDQYTGDKGQAILAQPSYAGTQGYCTTRATAEKHDIHSVYDLSNPDKISAFDSNGDGKGEIWLGAAGWLSTGFERIRARDYGFADFFDLQTTDEAVATAALDAAVKKGTGWVGYCYAPHQNFARYDLVQLEEPPYDPNAWNVVDSSDPNWLEKSSIASAYKDAAIHMAYSRSLKTRAPEVAALLERVTFTTEEVNQLAYAIAVENTPPREAAQEWIAAHPDIVAQWTAD